MNTATRTTSEFHSTARAILNRRSHEAALVLEAAFAESVAASAPKVGGGSVRGTDRRQPGHRGGEPTRMEGLTG